MSPPDSNDRDGGAAFVSVLVSGLCAASLCLVAAGCSAGDDPTSPSGGYRLFRRAFIDADVSGMWRYSDERTRGYFRERYGDLVEMDRDIGTHLPQTDRRLARRESGAVLLDDIDGPEGLFERIVRPRRVVVDRQRRVGSEVESVRIGEERETAIVTTRAGRTVRLTRGSAGEWGVDLVGTLEVLPERLKWVEENRRAIEETVRSIRERRRAEREAIIAELMDVE